MKNDAVASVFNGNHHRCHQVPVGFSDILKKIMILQLKQKNLDSNIVSPNFVTGCHIISRFRLPVLTATTT